MKKIQVFRTLFLTFLLALTCINFAANTSAQENPPPQTSRTRGIELYQKGNYLAAITALQAAVKIDKKDGEAFYLLGAAQLQTNQAKEAQKSFKTAAKLLPQDMRPTNGLAYAALQNNKPKEAVKYAETLISRNPNDAEAYFLLGTAYNRNSDFKNALTAASRAIALDPKFAPAYVLHTDATLSDVNPLKDSSSAELAQRFAETAAGLEKYLATAGNSVQTNELRDHLDDIKMFAAYFKRRTEPASDIVPQTIAPPDPNVTPLNILSKPRADYTEKARQKNISGTVVLAILFSKVGRIRYVFVQQGLGGGLTEQSVIAARKIQFTPKKINGEPVSIIRNVEFVFSLY